MNNPLISICIPTYNRAEYLRDCLNSVVSQFKDKEVYEQIEVIISDNASTDTTHDVVKEFQKEFKNIHYFKNEKNLGFDKNLLNVIEKSSGEYCLTFGDDDGFFPGSFLVMITKINTMKAPYYMLNCWGYDHKLLQPVVSHPNKQIKKDQTYSTLEDFVRSIKKYIDLSGNFGGISNQLFNRKAWMNYNGKEKYIGTQVVHIFVLLTVFQKSPFVLIAESLVKTRNDNMRWDIAEGLETNIKRCSAAIKVTLWISDLYNLSLSPLGVKIFFLQRGYTIVFKEFIKKILFKIGVRR